MSLSQALLPNFLKPLYSPSLIRIGRDFDGGYLVDQRDVEASDVLIGMGLNDDCSFERQFHSINSVPVHVYDASVSTMFHLKNIFATLPFIYRPLNLYRATKAFIEYNKFFKGNRVHHKYFVGLDFSHLYVSLKTVRDKIEEGKKVFFKIDIEGSEYRILSELIDVAELTTGLVVEFHDVDLHLDKIQHFVDNYPLNLVHVHANNYAPINDDGLPFVLELTFSPHSPDDAEPCFPHILDMPNDRNISDIQLNFADV